jgi:GntR family transcriptional regulator
VANSDPVYLRVVEDLRRQILDGTLPAGSPIPSRVQLTRRYGVGETAARHALRVLVAEGLIVGRVGAGHFVRERLELLALHRVRLQDRHTPFASDMRLYGRHATWDRHSEPGFASAEIARRLRIAERQPITRTRFLFRGDGRPMQLATFYEPAEPGHLPAAGTPITSVSEDVYVRVPRTDESDRLELSGGTQVMHIERTHWSGEHPVETSDIVIPGDRFRLVYSWPVASLS